MCIFQERHEWHEGQWDGRGCCVYFRRGMNGMKVSVMEEVVVYISGEAWRSVWWKRLLCIFQERHEWHEGQWDGRGCYVYFRRGMNGMKVSEMEEVVVYISGEAWVAWRSVRWKRLLCIFQERHEWHEGQCDGRGCCVYFRRGMNGMKVSVMEEVVVYISGEAWMAWRSVWWKRLLCIFQERHEWHEGQWDGRGCCVYFRRGMNGMKVSEMEEVVVYISGEAWMAWRSVRWKRLLCIFQERHEWHEGQCDGRGCCVYFRRGMNGMKVSVMEEVVVYISGVAWRSVWWKRLLCIFQERHEWHEGQWDGRGCCVYFRRGMSGMKVSEMEEVVVYISGEAWVAWRSVWWKRLLCIFQERHEWHEGQWDGRGCCVYFRRGMSGMKVSEMEEVVVYISGEAWVAWRSVRWKRLLCIFQERHEWHEGQWDGRGCCVYFRRGMNGMKVSVMEEVVVYISGEAWMAWRSVRWKRLLCIFQERHEWHEGQWDGRGCCVYFRRGMSGMKVSEMEEVFWCAVALSITFLCCSQSLQNYPLIITHPIDICVCVWKGLMNYVLNNAVYETAFWNEISMLKDHFLHSLNCFWWGW